jgi:hypothetical protein
LPGWRGWARFRREWFVERFGSLKKRFELNDDDALGFLNGRLVLVFAIIVSAVVSCLFVFFTVLPWSNPAKMLVSVDSPVYYEWIVYMRSVNVNSALSFAFSNDRALFLVLAYAFSFFVSPMAIVQFVAALLIVVFGVVSLLVLRLLCPFRSVWVLGVLIVPFSFQALGLIYAGYFANMLALIFVFVYFLLFVRLLGSWSVLGFFGLLSVSVLVLFSHSWTWFIFAVSLLAFLFLEWRLAVANRNLWGRFKDKATFVFATVGVGLAADVLRGFLSSVSATSSVLNAARSGFGFPSSFVLSGMQKSVGFALGGVFANQLLFLLGVLGFLFLARFKSEISNFLVSWVFVACVSILFGTVNFVFDRSLFLVPWVVLCSLGLFFVLRVGSSWFEGRKRSAFCILILLFVFLVFLNYALSFLFNIQTLGF